MKNKPLSILLLIAASTVTGASELIYTPPINPSFGGHPNNSAHLMGGVANAINTYKAPSSSSGIEQQSSLERLAANLESRLISQLLSDIGTGNTSGIVDTPPDFTLNVSENPPGSGNLVIQIRDKNTGESTEINVSGLTPNN